MLLACKKGLQKNNVCRIRRYIIEYLWLKHLGKLLNAAEGITLSGVRKDEDRMQTELWRHPFSWGPKGQALRKEMEESLSEDE